MYDRGTIFRRDHGGLDDGLLRIAGLELLRQGAETKLTTDLGGLETVAVAGELQPVDFVLLVLHAVDRDATSAEFIEEHGVTRQTFPAVLLEQGVADAPHLLLRALSCRIGLGFPMRSRGVDFFGDSQPMLATEFFGHSRRSIAHESGVVDLSTGAGPIGDDVDMQIVGVLMRDGYPLMVIQPHLFGKKQGEAVQGLERNLRLVLRGDADLDEQELVFATAVVVADQLHRLVKRRFCSASCLLLWSAFSCVLSLFVVLILWFGPMRTDVITALSLGPPRPREQAQFVGTN